MNEIKESGFKTARKKSEALHPTFVLADRPTIAGRASSKVGGDTISVNDPTLRAMADRVVATLTLAADKALAHEAAPREFPIASDTDSVERIVLDFARAGPEPALKKAAVASLERLRTQAASAVGGHLDMSRIDLKAAVPIERQASKLEHVEVSDTFRNGLQHLVRRDDAAIVSAVSPFDAAFMASITNSTNRINTSAIDAKWADLGGADGVLGRSTGTVRPSDDGVGSFRVHEHGAIYWSPRTNAHEVHGAIRAKWNTLGAERGLLGYPTTDELTTPDGEGRFNHFQHGSIYWTPSTGAHEVHGAIRVKWSQLSWERGYLGYPITEPTN